MIDPSKHSRLTQQVNDGVNHIIKHEFKLLSFSADRAPNDGTSKFMRNIDTYNRVYAKPRMWEQYADNHQGVCLLFSHELLPKIIISQLAVHEWSRHGIVKYLDTCGVDRNDPVVDLAEAENSIQDAIEEYVKQLMPDFFFEKYDDYQNEHEYRFVCRSQKEDYIYVKFKNSLRAIVLGAEFSAPNLRPLLFYCAKNKVALLRSCWIKGRGQVEGFYNPTIPIEHNHGSFLDPYREDLAKWHPSLEKYEKTLSGVPGHLNR